MRKARVRCALAVGVLAAVAGCVQVFGLGDYGELPEEAGVTGSDATAGSEASPPGDAASAGDAGASNMDEGGHPDAPSADGRVAADSGQDGPLFSADACSGSGGNVCAPAAPPNWLGPVALWEGTTGAPSCPTFYLSEFEGGLSPSALAAQCACTCGAPSGSACGAAQLQLLASCSSACSGVSLLPGSCVSVQSAVSGCGTGAGFSVDGSVATGGLCQPDASVSLPAATWAMQAIACAPSAQSPVGCPAGQTCIPAAGTPFEAHYCVLQSGMNACPGGFPTQHVYYGDIDDTRGCSPCTCGAPTGIDCNSSAQVQTWGNPNCNANQGPTVSPLPSSACTPASGVHSVKLTTSPTGGSCTASGGQPTGGVSAQTVTTICCSL